ncbi:hypothetical protein C0Z18_13050 [Trinickia dabaoshanensis]|uniref:Response regulatory domain-containing protein n=1 Tax=Trinickia dabaoshanensis TaxID=564714 RepID=A0A2N7VRH4_9BURK|nr:response regulator [Trinickia dabaoshanensis]PMS19752.1 hypothetical protein C0Z18_13050 [Trinickia dabaoshanensis]TAM51878.1 MAG: response regulator [Paraburkholderia sp.]
MLKVLLVDDDPGVLDVLQHMLETQHYRVLTAQDDRVALEWVQRERPDLIITEASGPGIDCAEFCGLLKEDPSTRDVPVMILAALPLLSPVQRGSACAVLYKPVSTDDLLSAVRAVIDEAVQGSPRT